MPRIKECTRPSALPQTQANLVADATVTRTAVTRLSSRLQSARRPRAATVRKLAEAAARLAWQADMLAEWLSEAQAQVTFLEGMNDSHCQASSQRSDRWLSEIETYAALDSAGPLDAFEKMYCHPADLIEARLMDINSQ